MNSLNAGPIIEAHHLTKEVQSPEGPLLVLYDISFQVHPGEAVAILGASGSGKSTLLGLLAGLDLPTAGEVHLAGERLNSLDEDGRARVRSRSLGFVFQSFLLLPSLTALENVMLPLELGGERAARPRAKELLQRVGLGRRLLHRPSQLSGGEQQRVAIARAFATSPPLLFADEPTGNLDSRTGAQIIDLLFNLNREQKTTLMLVTHDEALAGRCDRQLELEAGRLRCGA